ncbi:MAG: hypothetical protein JZU55_02640 [Afipia sp.]|nr:hypothetical protein [Afipia sp.]
MALADSRKMILETSDHTQLGHASDADWKEYLHMVDAAFRLASPSLTAEENTKSDTVIPSSKDMDARFAWLEAKAIDMGYMLVPEPPHPDSPHAVSSDPSPTAPAPDVREAMHRASEAEAEAGRLSYLIKEGIYSEYDDKMVSLSIMDESEASIEMYGPVYLALADTHQIIPSRLFEAMVTSLGDNFEKLQAIYAEDSTLSAQPAKGER